MATAPPRATSPAGAGLPLRDARRGLTAIAATLVEREDGLVDLAGRQPPAELPPPRLLGAFVPVLLGWRSRAFLLDDHEAVITVNGLFRPFALVRGRAAATWHLSEAGVELTPFERLAKPVSAALAEEAADVVRFPGLEVSG